MELIGKMLRRLRDETVARKLASQIGKLAREIGDEIKIMHVCGTHEHTITYYGLRYLMPENVKLIAGPGCPVCITPAKEIDEVIELAFRGYRIFTYGDMYKVPGSRISLAQARAEGADVMVVYGFLDAVKKAKKLGGRNVFFAVGFETTAPTTAPHIVKGTIPDNLYLYVSYRLTVPAVRWMFSAGIHRISGIIAPGHVSAIVGSEAWRFLPEDFGIPVVVAGFEPLDVLLAVRELLNMVLKDSPGLVNEYGRVVRPEGNLAAKDYMNRAFFVADGMWRGIGIIPKSRLLLREEFQKFDIKSVEDVRVDKSRDLIPGCKCGEINLGLAVPTDCPYFGKACTPEHPIGPCMVSVEGTCYIWYKYGGERVMEILKSLGRERRLAEEPPEAGDLRPTDSRKNR